MEHSERQSNSSYLMQGWQKMVGILKGNRQKEMSIPMYHYYSPEELSKLSNKKNISAIDKWAVEKGRWAFGQSKEKDSAIHFAPVIWDNSRMSTWIDGRPVADTRNEQAEKLSSLKEQGYILSNDDENIIKDNEGERLTGQYFASNDGSHIIKVESYESRLIGEDPDVVLLSWDSNLAAKKERVDFNTAKELLEKNYTSMSLQDRDEFIKKLVAVEKGRKQFNNIMSKIHSSYPTIFGGAFTFGQSTIHKVDDIDGKVLPVSWALEKDNAISVGVYTKGNNQLHSLPINENNAYKYGSLLSTIEDSVQRERVKETTLYLVEALGSDFGEYKIFAKANNGPLLKAKEGIVNAVVATRNGNTFAFNLDSHKEIELDKRERIDLMTALKFEGLTERTRLRNEASIPLMKDYVDSLKDKDNIFSGDTDKLPEHSTVYHLCAEYEKNEEELYTNTSPEDRNEIIADVESSRLSYIQELQKMVDAYNSHSYETTQEDLIKLQALDEMFGHKNGHISKLQNQQDANNEEKAGVIEKKQELSVSTADEDSHSTKEQQEQQQEPRRHIRR